MMPIKKGFYEAIKIESPKTMDRRKKKGLAFSPSTKPESELQLDFNTTSKTSDNRM